MVTRLSGTPLFAKSRLKKLIKAASGGLFYARQRVTTEGKAMPRLIVLLNVDDAEGVEIAKDEFDENLTFCSWHEADDWCARNTRGVWVKTINLDDDDDD